MFFINEPMQFVQALKYARGKQALPTTLSSAELRTLGRDLRRRSLFSARVTDGDLLHLFDGLVEDIVGGPDEADFEARLAGERPLLMSVPEAKARLSDYLEEVGYQPLPGEEGTIKDLRSDRRRQLIVETNVLDTQGYGRWAAGQNTATLDQFPAQELVRMRFSKVPRDWQERWEAAREAAVVPGATSAASGRLVALKNHPIWQELGDGAGGYEDTLGNPWPPFAFNSGMDVMDVSRDEAIELGILGDNDEPPAPQPVNRLNESTEASVKNWSEELKRALARGEFKITDNGKTLSMANCGFGALRDRIAALAEALGSLPLAVEWANMGTHEGALKGWQTRRQAVAKDIKAARKAVRIGLNQKRDMPEVIQRGEHRVDIEHGRPGSMRPGVTDDGYGLSHVATQHPETLHQLPVTLARGSWHPHETDPNKAYIVHGDHFAIIHKQEHGGGNRSQTRWRLLTHFKNREAARSAKLRTAFIEGR